jgi:hypothetical protein
MLLLLWDGRAISQAQGNEKCTKKLTEKPQGKRSRNAFEGSLNVILENEGVKLESGFENGSITSDCEHGEGTLYPISVAYFLTK